MAGGFGTKKHQKKVLECYPPSGGPTGALSGKLSALCYYINAKPAKLLKVSAYLEKKVPKDLTRESPSHNIVTLEIIEGIMKGCPEYYGNFAPTVLKVIFFYSEALLTGELMAKLHKLFVEFCRLTKPVLPSIRSVDFFDLLTRVLQRLLKQPIAGQATIDPLLFGADIQAVAAMEDFKAPGGEERMEILVTTITEHVRDQSESNNDIFLEDILQHRIVNFTDERQMMSNAFVCLVEGSNSSTIILIINIIFKEFDRTGWNHQRLTNEVFKLLIYAVPAQYICVILSEIFRRLDRADDLVTSVLADTIAELLRSNRSPLGYSALELTRNLLKLLRKQKPLGVLDPDLRVSFTITKIPPPRTVYSICNAFVSLLKNATFALQKYEIIESLILRAFFPPNNGYLQSASFPNDNLKFPLERSTDKHSVGTVTLDSTEEVHFRQVVWGILFALAEEGTPPSALRLVFVDVHTRLFDLLFRMVSFGDADFTLNSLVLLNQLLIHGLPIIPNKRNRISTLDPSFSLPKTSTYILTRCRVAIASFLTDPIQSEYISIMHFAGIFQVIKAILPDCDTFQLGNYVRFVHWILLYSLESKRLTFEDHVCIIAFSWQIFELIGENLSLASNQAESSMRSPSPFSLFARSGNDKLEEVGIERIDMSEILDSSRPSAIVQGYKEFKFESLAPTFDATKSAFNESIPRDFISKEYHIDDDKECLPSLTPSAEKVPTFRHPHHSSSNQKTVSGAFSRLSKLGSTGASTTTAPAFYGADSSYKAGVFSADSLTISDSTASGSTTSRHSELLESKFDDLTLKIKEKRNREQTKSAIFFRS